MVEGEVALKVFKFANTLLPMTGLSVFAIARLKQREKKRFWGVYGPGRLKTGSKVGRLLMCIGRRSCRGMWMI